MLKEKKIAAFALAVSLFGLLLTQIIGTFELGESPGTTYGSKLLGGLFVLLCVLGIIAVLRPGQCNRLMRSEGLGKGRSSDVEMGNAIPIRGHHPDCENYSTHVFVRNGKVYCAGCMGLLTGAATSLAMATGIFMGDLVMPGGGLPTLFIGGSMIAIGLIHFAIGSKNRAIRFVVNAFYPLGALLILASIEQRTQSVRSGLFVLLIILFWIITRVLLARWDHVRTCGSCDPGCSRNTASHF